MSSQRGVHPTSTQITVRAWEQRLSNQAKSKKSPAGIGPRLDRNQQGYCLEQLLEIVFFTICLLKIVSSIFFLNL